MIRGIIIGAVLSLIAIAGGIYLVIVSGRIYPGADDHIPPIERWAAKTSLRAYLKENTPATVNPFKPTDENLTQGVKVYVNNCAVCHGYADNKETEIGKGLYKKPNLFADEDWSQDKDGLVYWFIDHGVKLTGMPAFGETLPKEDIWKLVLFIKNIKHLPESTEKYWRSFPQSAPQSETPAPTSTR